MTDRRAYIFVIVLLMVVSGCQTTGPTPRENQTQANDYLLQAQAYESEGNLAEALEQYKRAQALEPDSSVVNESIQRLEARLQQLAETHYQAGVRFRDKGKWELAKKEFLRALAYWPDHQQAALMLQQRQPEGKREFITHIIGPGESISKLALKYYGDYRKYHYIANFNNMTDATRVRVGQKIMVPTIAGVSIDDLNRISAGGTASSASTSIEGDYTIHQIAPGESLSKIAHAYYGDYNLFSVIAKFNGIDDPTSVRVGQKIKIPKLDSQSEGQPESSPGTVYTPSSESDADAVETVEPPTELTPEPLPEETPESVEPVDQVAEYRETGISLFDDGKYDDAILELNKVLSADAEDPEAKRYLAKAWLEKGRQHVDAGRIEKAKKALTSALNYDQTCSACNDLLQKCRTLEADEIISNAETLYKNNQFDQATAALERALAISPDNRRARELMFQTQFQQALIQFEDQDYLAAKNGFEKALSVNPECEECRTYIDKSLNEYKEYHYNEGIVAFGREALKDAITAWEKVAAVDPGYKDVQRNLEKARLLDERLERIKKGGD